MALSLEDEFDYEFGRPKIAIPDIRVAELPSAAPRRGNSFGNILAHLGDAISIGAGGEANYKNRVDNRTAQEAFDLFQINPMQGIQMLAGVNPKLAEEWLNNTRARDAQVEKNRIDALDSERKGRLDNDKYDEVTRQRLAGMLRTGNATNWAQLVEQANNYAKSRGFDASSLNIPSTFTEGWSDTLDSSLMEPKDLATLAERQVAREESNALRERQQNISAAGTAGKLRVQGANAAATRAATNARAAQARADRLGKEVRTGKTKTVEAGQKRQDALNKEIRSTVAKVVKANPGLTSKDIQRSAKTGRVRYTTDGGKTWKMAN